MSTTNRPLGFELVSVNYGNGLRTAARFQCLECAATAEAPVRSGSGLNPEATAKWVRERGWKANAFKKAGTYCPKCSGPKAAKNDTDSKIRKVIPMSQTIPAAVALREATADQRMKIRAHLDKSFDDSVGMYLDGLSDLRIAELVGVPRIIVERMRDTAYGPIKVDPAMQALREELAALKVAVDGQQAGIDNLKSKVVGAASRLEAMLTKAAAA